ncbi:uncharacterized protein LOC122021352 [Zingiber officinale]|uniref:Glycine-rich protein n=1 Tax=Zingiber officinale TaxID=94328 RepID=A0A8J5F0S0_ZINOF|nr:uncharacterized protein LOC122021352 [Zingiber officinale]KAG6478953.1 hypothetical protein ZIOFF_062401 [Zingiber officinale]
MASSVAESALAHGPVMSMMKKRLRSLRKKLNRILQMEDTLAQGKLLNKEQKEFLRSKPTIVILINEYEKLRAPLAAAVQEELDRAAFTAASPAPIPQEEIPVPAGVKEERDRAVMDVLALVYFGCMFDVKPQSEFAAMMLTRMHERGCCLTYDYVTDDATDLLREHDLDAISGLASLVTSRSVYSGVSHKDTLQACLQHAKLWLVNADQPIHSGASLTYAGLREKLNKILASDYFTTTPEMKAPGDLAAAVGKYGASCQVQFSESMTVPSSMVQSEDVEVPIVPQEDQQQEFQLSEVHPDHEVSLVDEQLNMGATDPPVSYGAVVASNQEQENQKVDLEDLNLREVEQREHQYNSRGIYHNNQGGIRGPDNRRGYHDNGRGGRGGNGGYQNGRSRYHDSTYSKHYYNPKGSGGQSSGAANYTDHGSHVASNVDLDTRT